jgi:hypothetical protein
MLSHEDSAHSAVSRTNMYSAHWRVPDWITVGIQRVSLVDRMISANPDSR